MGYPPVAFATQDRLMAAFVAAGATRPGCGITQEELGLRWHTPTLKDSFRRMLEAGVAVRDGDGRFYLDESQGARLRSGRSGTHPWRLGA